MGDLEDVAERISHHGPTVPVGRFQQLFQLDAHRHRALGGRPRPRHRHRRTRRPGTAPARLKVRSSPASPRSLSRLGGPARQSPWRQHRAKSSPGRPHPRRQCGGLSSGSPAEHSSRARPSIPPSRCVLGYSHWFIATWARMPQCRLVNSQVHRPPPAKYENSWPSSRKPDIPTFRDAHGPMGFTQRQAGGKFSRDEASAFIAQLLDAESEGSVTVRTPAWRQSAQDQLLSSLPSEQLAGELRRRGWTVNEP